MKHTATIVLLMCVVFAAVGGIIYSNTLNAPFLFDSSARILENHNFQISEPTIGNLKNAALNKPGSKSRPVTNISFALNYLFHQYDPPGYRIVNIIIHIINAILLFFVFHVTLKLSGIKTSPKHFHIIAFLSALIWFTNPLHIQSVTYIVQRANSMAAMFYLASLCLYIRGRLSGESTRKAWPWFAGAVLAWIFSLGCKQNAAILPFFVFLYEWFFFQELSAAWLRNQLKWIIIAVVIFAIVTLFFLGAEPFERLKSLHAFSKNQFTYTERLLTQPRVVIYYLSLFLFPQPARLNLDYDYALSTSILNPITTLLSILVITAAILFAVYSARRQRLLAFSILWYLGNNLIESSIIPLDVIYEHRTYIPSMLIPLMPVTWAFIFTRKKQIVVGFLLLPSLLFSYWTLERNKVWQDKITFWQDCVNKSPDKARPHFNLGAAYAGVDQEQAAMKHYRRALELDPLYTEVHNNIGNLYAKKGQVDEAIREYEMALKGRPDFYKAHHNIAIALMDLKRYDQAATHLAEVIRLKPDSELAYLNLGKIYEEEANTAKALDYYFKTLEQSPGLPAAHNNIGKIYAQKGDRNKAESHFKAALQKDPDNSDALVNIGKLAQEQGKPQEAMAYYQKAIEADNENASAHYNIANLYMTGGSKENAENHYREALALNDEMAEAHTNLGLLLEEKGYTNEALDHYQKAVELKPNYAPPYNNIGNIFARKNDFESAIPYYHEAIRLEPSFDDAQANLGIALMRTGDIQGAKDHFQSALEANPTNQRARSGLELIQSSTGAASGQTSPEILHRQALAHAARGEYDLAVKAFKQILEMLPSEPGTCYNIACMYAQMGRVNDAIAWLTRAIQNGYENWDAIEHDPDLDGIRESEAFKTLIQGR